MPLKIRWITVVMVMAMLAAQSTNGEGQNPMLIVADSVFALGQWQTATGKYKEVMAGLKEDDDDYLDILLSCQDQIGTCYYMLDDYAEAIYWFQQALEVSRDKEDLDAIASMLNNIGLNYKMLGNYDKAIEFYLEAIGVDESQGKGGEIAKTLNNIGMVYRVWGKYDEAITYLERSLRLKNNLKDMTGVSSTLNNLGLVYTEWKKYDEAILNFRESLKMAESLGDERQAAIMMNNLGRVYFYQNQYDSALWYFKKTLEMQSRINDLDQVALATNNIGKVLRANKQYNEAAQSYQAALDIYTRLGKEDEKATVLANLSDVNRAMGQNNRALQLLDSSTRIAQRLNLLNQLQQNYFYYSEIYSNLGNDKKALEYYKKYSDVKDSVFSENILTQLSDFQIKYETEKKENEIKILRQNELIHGLALKRQKLFRNFMLALSCLLLALASLIFYSLQTKKKDNRIIAEARKKSDQLLLNILPAGIANDLKERGKTEPQHFENVTACFVDIVNFTEKSATIDPIVLIGELNDIFTSFDNIIEKFTCERIKTIGDSYLAVCGVPVPDPNHAYNIVSSCVEMIHLLRKRNTQSIYPWEIRIGVHSGEVIAGVVGVKKYIYDVFGDTINTASRMESSSEPMKVNISESTYHKVKDQFETELRGELEVKGKGKLKMYFVKA